METKGTINTHEVVHCMFITRLLYGYTEVIINLLSIGPISIYLLHHFTRYLPVMEDPAISVFVCGV